jgi:hypothetical protein
MIALCFVDRRVAPSAGGSGGSGAKTADLWDFVARAPIRAEIGTTP